MTKAVSDAGYVSTGYLIQGAASLYGRGSGESSVCSSEEFIQFINSTDSNAPSLTRPKRNLSHEQMLILLSLLVDSGVKKAEDQLKIEISHCNVAAEKQRDALIEQNKKNVELMRKAEKSSWFCKALGKIARFARVIQGLPAVGAVIQGVAQAVKMRQLPGVGQMVGGCLLLSIAVVPAIDLALSFEGKGRTLNDLVGEHEWITALLSLDAGTLLKLGVEQVDDSSAATISATVAGALVMTVAMATIGAAAVKGSGSNDKVVSTARLFMGIAAMTEGVCNAGQGMQQVESAEIQQDLTDSTADMKLIEIAKKQVEEQIQLRIDLIPQFTQLSQAIFKDATESLKGQFEGLSTRLGYLKPRNAMA